MGHGHAHASHHVLAADTHTERWRSAKRVTLLGMALNAFLCVAEGGIGWMCGSRALLADAVHTLSDVLDDCVVLIALRYAAKPPDARFPWGRGKVETLTALGLALFLVALAVGIGADAAAALQAGGGAVRAPLWALGGALLGIVVQETNFRMTQAVARRTDNDALMANAWHHRSDALSSLAVACGLAGAWLFDAWWLDAVAAIAVGGMILLAALGLLQRSVMKLADVSVDETTLKLLRDAAEADAAVAEVHDLRARAVGPRCFVELHAVVHPDMNVREACVVAHRIEAALRAAVPAVEGVQVHMEPAKQGVIIPLGVASDGGC
ncbi:MAG: cation transporter [Planctomycetes bacterium]|nr:cation transporter [Planctomycetota bacterium]